MTLNWTQKQYIYERLKDVLKEKFDSIGGKSMVEVYGPTTQQLIREAVNYYCFHKDIKPKEKKVANGEDEEGNKVYKTNYVFTMNIKLLTGEELLLEREISKDILEAKK